MLNKFLLFPTKLYQFKLDDGIIDKLDNLIEEEYRFWKGSTHYISVSSDQEHLRKEKVFTDLNSTILSRVQEIIDDLKIIKSDHFISGMWHNVSSEPYRHHQHMHPNAFLSGIIYVRAPKGAGPTVFSDPRSQKYVFHPDYSEFNIENSPTFCQRPERGTVVIFPGWLYHCADNGTMEPREKRITTAFNINLHGKSTLKTAKLTY